MTAFEKGFEEVKALADKFHNNLSFYTSPTYQEAEVRKHFIDKFFIALGWDVNHDHHHNPYEQEVKVEKSQKQQQAVAQKRADYAFYTASNFKDVQFFTEAKKPAVGLKHPDHYFQTIRYGWNANTPIAVLTDFEELHIIDCRYKPDINFAFNGQHKAYRYTDYNDKEKFAEIYWLFSREAVTNNSLGKYAGSLPKLKGKKASPVGGGLVGAAIDDSFLEYIDAIRENIAKAFKRNDENMDSEQLTEAAQRTVDRLVFIRFLEDKLIEPENHLSEWRGWKDFIADCRKLDAKYNGVVFKKHFIDEQDFGDAEEKMFRDICSDISNLNNPYDFNYIPIHILGSIYERFLGKVVRATGKRVFIEEKPEVRKAGGVYYTPKYIVDYIVANTVGKLIEGKTPKQISELRFADIACGSGSFLIGVYDVLLDYHRKFYIEKFKDRTEELDKRNEDFEHVMLQDKQWIITLKLKQKILLNNIYGVDIDQQAVEVTQLSLFLKMLEDETTSSTQVRQGALFSKVLPDLGKNIVCGNSLIGWDIMNGQSSLSFGEGLEGEVLKKLNPMDYETVFPSIMRSGGFDAIVGNPPWGSKEILDSVSLNYLNKKFQRGIHNVNIFALFIDASILYLNKNGLIGLLIPKNFLKTKSYYNYRIDILKNYAIEAVTDFGQFPGVAQECISIFVSKINNDNIIRFIHNKGKYISLKPLKKEDILKDVFGVITLSKNQNFDSILYKFDHKTFELSEKFMIGRGMEFGRKGYLIYCHQCKNYFEKPGKTNAEKKIADCKFCGCKITMNEPKNNYTFISKTEGQNKVPLLIGNSIDRYEFKTIEYFIEKGIRGIDYKKLDSTIPKLYFIRIAKTLRGIYDDEGKIALNALNWILNKSSSEYSLFYILGILNSTLFANYCDYKITSGAELTIRFSNEIMRSLPVKEIDFNNMEEKQLHHQLVTLVTQMLEAKKQLPLAKTERDKNFLENKCASLDRQIDRLVYQLYDLTEEEIRIVEGV